MCLSSSGQRNNNFPWNRERQTTSSRLSQRQALGYPAARASTWQPPPSSPRKTTAGFSSCLPQVPSFGCGPAGGGPSPAESSPLAGISAPVPVWSFNVVSLAPLSKPPVPVMLGIQWVRGTSTWSPRAISPSIAVSRPGPLSSVMDSWPGVCSKFSRCIYRPHYLPTHSSRGKPILLGPQKPLTMNRSQSGTWCPNSRLLELALRPCAGIYPNFGCIPPGRYPNLHGSGLYVFA